MEIPCERNCLCEMRLALPDCASVRSKQKGKSEEVLALTPPSPPGEGDSFARVWRV